MTGDAEDFFANTSVTSGRAPGVILRSRDVTVTHPAGVGAARQIVYTTTAGSGFPVAASGIVLEPGVNSANGSSQRRVVIFCPTFHGLGGACAPSQLVVEGTEPDAPSMAAALAMGWTVAIPDGIGLGLTGAGPHHFLAAASGAHAVLDLARAICAPTRAGELPKPVAVWGYGDGGRVAAAAAEQHPGYAPELDLRAVAAGAVITDPGALIPSIDGGPFAGMAFAAMIGLGRAYAHLPIDHILSDDGVRAVTTASTLDAGTLLAEYGYPLGRWCERPDPWRDPIWRHVLASEVLPQKTPIVPVHLYQGLLDALVPVASTRALFADYSARQVEVTWSQFDATHLGAADLGTADVFAVLREGFTRPPHSGTLPAT
ncbi:lipase family protein [Nocardia sp. NPDC058497]|uniref:lipase family protein n=1 Tax=Nocardia sp. NPDC058497 TaxID=3346529 RepID=UPI003664BCD0